MLDKFVSIWGNLLEPVMTVLYGWCGNYALAILLFTIFAKIILLPLTIMLHLNSIKMIKMQPELNFAKAEFSNDKDRLSEEQLKLYKKYNYRPMLGLIPLAIQIILLMGVIDVVYRQLSAGMSLWGFNMYCIPFETGGRFWLWPILAGISQLALCLIQNKFNVLQSEQGIVNKLGTMLASTAMTLYLGSFVRVAVLIYWICGNLTAIIQLFILNLAISPKKHIDYEQLEKSREALAKSKKRNSQINKKFFAIDPYRKVEKKDYKRFYEDYNKQIVFFAEAAGFYKYYKDTIEYILKSSDVVIHYVTGDPKDPLLEKETDKFKVYYIGTKRIISFMMKMDANVVVMSTPDLDKSYVKKSMMRDDVEYIYLPHGVDSGNLTTHTNGLENFNTVLCPGIDSVNELRASEKEYKLKEKNLVEWGSSVIDNMIAAWEAKSEAHVNETSTILIAPSWQDDNIIDYCIEPLLEALLKTEYKIILRPHPQYVRYGMDYLNELNDKFGSNEMFELQTDFSSNDTVYNADVLVTDWSSIAFEYSYATLKPTLFIDTPMKVMNKEWKRINIEPINIFARNQIGKSVDPNEIEKVTEVAKELVDGQAKYREIIRQFRSEHLFNIGNCGEIAGQYIIEAAKRVDDNKAEYLKYLAMNK